jgi:hypothetical protein
MYFYVYNSYVFTFYVFGNAPLYKNKFTYKLMYKNLYNTNSYCLGVAPKKSDEARSNEQFSLTFYIRRSYKFQNYFPTQLGHSNFLFPHFFYDFFFETHWTP